MSLPELSILGNAAVKVSADNYWLISPRYYLQDPWGIIMKSDGNSYYYTTGNSYGIRPAISLTPGITYSSGDGSMANPYIVDTN